MKLLPVDKVLVVPDLLGELFEPCMINLVFKDTNDLLQVCDIGFGLQQLVNICSVHLALKSVGNRGFICFLLQTFVDFFDVCFVVDKGREV